MKPGTLYPWILLTLILVLGFLLRVHRLDEQSVWFDELNSIPIDSSIPFENYWERIQAVNPDHMPIFFLMMYGWSQLVGLDPIAGRLLSIALGLGAAFLLFPIGRRCFGTGPALLAVLFQVLSPNQVNCDQGLRAYSLLMFLSAISIYSFVMASRDGGKRWWATNLLANNLLVWTHLAATCIPICQGLALLLTWWFSPRLGREGSSFALLFRWCVAHLSLAAAGLYWSMKITDAPNLHWYRPISFSGFLNDLLGDDLLLLNPHFGIALPLWEQHRSFWPDWLKALDFASGLVILGLGVAGIAFGCILLYKKAVGHTNVANSRIDARSLLFIVLLTVAPATAMAIVSQINPIYMPRYTQYASLTLHVLSAAAVLVYSGAFIRITSIVIIVVAYAFQLTWILNWPVREHWFEVASEIRTYWRENDLVLVLGEMGDASGKTAGFLLDYNLNSPEINVEAASCVSGAAAIARARLTCGETFAPSSVWLVREQVNTHEVTTQGRAEITRYGLDVTESIYPMLRLYRMSLPVESLPELPAISQSVWDFVLADPVLGRQPEWATFVLNAACADCGEQCSVQLTIDLVEDVALLDLTIADRLAELLLKTQPAEPSAHALRLVAAWHRGDKDAAQEALALADQHRVFTPELRGKLTAVESNDLARHIRDELMLGSYYLGPGYLASMVDRHPPLLPCVPMELPKNTHGLE